jgi:hypothetical protein
MEKQKRYSNKNLALRLFENKNTIEVLWEGKSTEREPANFLSPILAKVLNRAASKSKRITMDFRELSYMNSSTITPVIKILERAKKSKTKITIFYQKSLNWQELNFSALEIFNTENNQIQIKGL